MNTTVIESPQPLASSLVERWYVVIVMCLVYAISIADRYVVSTVLEPIRLDLKLTDGGVGFLTGVPLEIVLRILRHSHVMAGRSQEPAQHSRRLDDRLVGLHGAVWTVAHLLAIPGGPHRRRHRRNRRYAPQTPSSRIIFRRTAVPWRSACSAGRADRRGGWARTWPARWRCAYGWRAAFLALGIPGHRRHDHLSDHS